jgi:arabinose-5-phosphate isomerase
MTARRKASVAKRRSAAGSGVTRARKRKSETLDTARKVLRIETDALKALSSRLDERFERAVETILACRGRLVVTGMGKSGQICRKMAATFASTGTSAFFLHAAEAAHGDLGMFARGDVCLAVSNSGTTRELLSLLPGVKRLRLPLIAMTGGLDSPLAEAADILLDLSIEQEACPLGLAPTASTTTTLALGDALAVAVLKQRGFSEDDFALLHPGGALGSKLLRVRDVMHANKELPSVARDTPIRKTLEIISKGGMGVAAVVDARGRLSGVVTDGDVRRGILRRQNFTELEAADIMTTAPKTVPASALAAEALAIMEDHSITSLFIVDPKSRRPLGIVHLHDLLKAGTA